MTKEIKVYEHAFYGLRKAKSNLGFFHVNADGQPAYAQCYRYVGNFFCERAIALDKEGFFHIKMDGSPAYNNRYDGAYEFTMTAPNICLAIVMNHKNRCFHIKPNGERAYRKTFDYASNFYSGLAVVREDKEYYFILPNGTPAHTEYDRFDFAAPFQNGIAKVVKNGRKFKIFPDGTEKVDFKKKP